MPNLAPGDLAFYGRGQFLVRILQHCDNWYDVRALAVPNRRLWCTAGCLLAAPFYHLEVVV